MKKILMLLLITIVISGCQERKSEFEIAMINMDELESVEITFTMQDVPFFGSIVGSTIIDGDKTESTFLSMTNYTFYEEDIEYELVEFNDGFYSVVAEEDEDDNDAPVLFDSFIDLSEEDFTFEDGIYKANDNIDDMMNLTLTIENDYVVELDFSVESEFGEDMVELTIIMEFESFNDATVTLPEYEPMNDFIEGLMWFDDQWYNYSETTSGFIIEDFATEIIVIESSHLVQVSTWGDDIEYFYLEDRVLWGENGVELEATMEEYLAQALNPVLSEEEAEVLQNILDYLGE